MVLLMNENIYVNGSSQMFLNEHHKSFMMSEVADFTLEYVLENPDEVFHTFWPDLRAR